MWPKIGAGFRGMVRLRFLTVSKSFDCFPVKSFSPHTHYEQFEGRLTCPGIRTGLVTYRCLGEYSQNVCGFTGELLQKPAQSLKSVYKNFSYLSKGHTSYQTKVLSQR